MEKRGLLTHTLTRTHAHTHTHTHTHTPTHTHTGTVAEGAPIIPISAQLKYNIEVICEYISKKIPIPLRDFTSEPRLIVIRSFDVNKPGAEVDDLKGGVAGGSILRGVLKVQMDCSLLSLLNTKHCLYSTCPCWTCSTE